MPDVVVVNVAVDDNDVVADVDVDVVVIVVVDVVGVVGVVVLLRGVG